MVKIIVTLTVVLFAFSVASPFAAQKPGILPGTKEAQRPAEPAVAYEDPLGRSTPQGTIFGFMKSAAKRNYDQALAYLDTKMVGTGAERLILALQAVLERGFSGKLATLSSEPEGDLDDKLPPSKERVATVRTPSGRLDVLLDRVQRGMVEGSGTGFACPSQTTYLAEDAGLDVEKSRKAIETVRHWREEGKRPFPDPLPETISKIGGKIEDRSVDSALRDKRKE